MKFRKWLNENIWVDAAKDYLKLPPAMPDSEIMKIISNLPEIEQQMLISYVPIHKRRLDRDKEGTSELTYYKNYRDIHDTIQTLEEDTDDQIQKLKEIKMYLREDTSPFGDEETMVTTSAMQERPMKNELAYIEVMLRDASQDSRNNFLKIREIWQIMGWHKRRKEDAGVRGLGENFVELGGDIKEYFPGGFGELKLKVDQISRKVKNVTKDINLIMNKMRSGEAEDTSGYIFR